MGKIQCSTNRKPQHKTQPQHTTTNMSQKIRNYAAAGGGYLPYDVNIGIVNMVDYCTV
jgi:hypothetical protein